MPLKEIEYKLWITTKEHFDKFDKNLQKIIFSFEIIFIKSADIDIVEQFFQTVFRDAAIQTKRSLPNDPQTSKVNHQHENGIIPDQIGVLEVFRIFEPNLLCVKLNKNPQMSHYLLTEWNLLNCNKNFYLVAWQALCYLPSCRKDIFVEIRSGREGY